jgi:hypothetical protein
MEELNRKVCQMALLWAKESIEITLANDILELPPIQVLTRQNVAYLTVVG